MTYDWVITSWVSVIKNILGEDYTVIRAEGAVGAGAVRPDGKFVTVKLISGPNDYTIDEVSRVNVDCNLELVSAKTFTISVQAFREGAMDAILNIKMQLENPEKIEMLEKISVTQRGDVTDLSQQFETGFEERFSLDISFAVGFTAPTNIGIIDNVGEINNG